MSHVEAGLAVDADRDMLASALGNLLQNAFKFTEADTEVTLAAHGVADRILLEAEDHCGGLPPVSTERMIEAFAQVGSDRSGLGLGLAISKRAVEANGAMLHLRNVPGSGCVLAIDLPRKAVRA